MMPLFLAVTAAAEHAAEPGMIEKFGLEPKFVLMQVVSFLILFGVLYWFGIKPTIATMEVRNKKISDGLKHAEETQYRLTAAAAESAQIVKTAQFEAQKIVEETRKKQQAEAVQHTSDLLAKARTAIELERKKMMEEARGEIARLVVTTTERVLARKLTDADRAAYNETAAQELTTI